MSKAILPTTHHKIVEKIRKELRKEPKLVDYNPLTDDKTKWIVLNGKFHKLFDYGIERFFLERIKKETN